MSSRLLKRPFLTSLAITCLAIRAQAADSPALITTSGSAEIRVVPDVYDMNFDVEVRNANLEQALKQQAEKAGKVLAALREGGVAEVDLQSSTVTVETKFDDERVYKQRQVADAAQAGDPTRVRYFSVSQEISATVHDSKKVAKLTVDAVAAGATDVRPAVPRTSQLRKYRDQARAQAILAAKEKAAALASGLSVKVGRPYTIREGDTSISRFGQNRQTSISAGDPAESGAATFAAGQISIGASVTVSFRIE